MTKIYYPWYPTDDEKLILTMLHGGSEVVTYDSSYVLAEDTGFIEFLKEHPDEIVYIGNEPLPILLAVEAKLGFRLVTTDNFTNGEVVIAGIWEYRPGALMPIRQLWPRIDVEQVLSEAGILLF